MKRSLRLALMGTGPFAVPSFEAIAAAGHDLALVLTRPTGPIKSRGGAPPTPVRDWAGGRGLPIAEPATINAPETVAMLKSLDADLWIVCDYGQILRPEALAAARWGGINLHGSLLPAYRGAAPVQRALLAGDAETGVSVIHMTPRLDGGPILATERTAIRGDETAGELERRLSQLGVAATMKAIELLIKHDGDGSFGHRQDTSLVTKAPRLAKAEAEIDWRRPGRMIDAHVRGMQPWPVAFTHAAVAIGKPPLRLAIRQVKWTADATITPEQIGTLIATEPPSLSIGCGDGHVTIERVQPAGKKEMSGDDLLNGYRIPIGTRFDIKVDAAG